MSKLAIHDGNPSVPSEIEKKSWPVITEQDKEMVLEVLDSGELAGAFAPQATSLEEEFSDFIGSDYCIAVNSGTAALHAAVAAAGVGPGDEVITPSYSFLASATAIMHHNGIPVFVDIDLDTFNIDPDQIESKITPRTKAIVPVHLHGYPANLDKIREIAEKHDLIVIEDACQAHGTKYKGQNVGTIGDMGTFSLNKTKNLPGGEGGLFVTDDEELYNRAQKVRMFGEEVQAEGSRSYVAYSLGWNYRTQELPAALARSQLRKLDKYNRKAKENGDYLGKAIRDIPGIVPPPISSEEKTNIYHKYRVRLEPEELGFQDVDPIDFRNKVGMALEAEGVPAALWSTFPLPANPLFQEKEGYGKGCPWSCSYARDSIEYEVDDYPNTIKLVNNSLVIGTEKYPLYPQEKSLIERYAKGIKKVFDNINEVLETIEAPNYKSSNAGETLLSDFLD